MTSIELRDLMERESKLESKKPPIIAQNALLTKMFAPDALDLEVCALNHEVIASTLRGHQQPVVVFDWDPDDCNAEFHLAP